MFFGLGAPSLGEAREDTSDMASPGFYLGVRAMGATYTVAENELEDELGGFVEVDIDDVAGFDAVLGYRAGDHVAVEAQFDYLDSAEIAVEGFFFGNPVAELDSITATVNAKLYAATGRFQPYALFGVGVMRTELTATSVNDDATGPVIRFGGGAEFFVTRNIAIDLGVDYLLPRDDVEDLDYVSYGGGLVLHF
ncbi:MAG: porin family protein [bacterium]|nr:porin family protein [bacterium]